MNIMDPWLPLKVMLYVQLKATEAAARWASEKLVPESTSFKPEERVHYGPRKRVN